MLEPVYEALELAWDPGTVGAVEDEAPGVTLGDVETAIIAELARSYRLERTAVDPRTLALAQELEAEQRVEG